MLPRLSSLSLILCAKVNKGKTDVVIFGNYRKRKDVKMDHLGEPLKVVNGYTYLGMEMVQARKYLFCENVRE